MLFIEERVGTEGCMQDRCIMLGGRMTLLLSLFVY